MDHGTDRDVALQIVSALDSCAQFVAGINDNLYVAHITTQPTNQEGAIGDSVVFTVVANNAVGYQWQYRPILIPDDWRVSSHSGNKTASMTVVASADRYNYEFRCQVTGKDNANIYSNAVRIIEPEAQG